jgi:hypothetical protein
MADRSAGKGLCLVQVDWAIERGVRVVKKVRNAKYLVFLISASPSSSNSTVASRKGNDQ